MIVVDRLMCRIQPPKAPVTLESKPDDCTYPSPLPAALRCVGVPWVVLYSISVQMQIGLGVSKSQMQLSAAVVVFPEVGCCVLARVGARWRRRKSLTETQE